MRNCKATVLADIFVGSKWPSHFCLNNKDGEDISFGPPPEEYSYRCSQCRHEMKVNEAIIDFEIGMTEFAGMYYEGFMLIVGCPNCNQETMEYVKA